MSKGILALIVFLLVLTFCLGVQAFDKDNLGSNHCENFSQQVENKEIFDNDDGVKNLDEGKKQTLELVRSGCCSWHGGVCGCDSQTDRIICCDGTLSPTCTCSGY